MCAQCMVTATAAAGAATGLRSWLAVKSFAWVTPLRLKRITFALITAALVLAATGSGSG